MKELNKTAYMKKARHWARAHVKELKQQQQQSCDHNESRAHSSLQYVRTNEQTKSLLKKIKEQRDFYKLISIFLAITCILLAICGH